MFETAKIITNARFSACVPQNVFHREIEPMPEGYVHDKSLCNRHVLFRRSFVLAKAPGKAILSITADDYYKLYINGVFVTQGPAAGYPQHYYYNTVDVTEYLHEGENLIVVHTYYQGLINRVWVSADMRHMMLCQLDADGKTVLVSDESWKCAEHTGYSASHTFGYETQYAEDFDSRAAEVGFEKTSFDDSAWEYAKERLHTDYTFVLQPTKQLEIYDVHPARITRRCEGDKTVLFCDLGFEAVGAVCLRAKGLPGSVVVIRCGEECLTDENGADLDAVRYQMRCNCVYEETWTLSGGDDVLVPYDYKAFRYFELHLPKGCEMKDEDIVFQVRHYPYKEAVPCPSDDPELQKIWRLCADTLKYGAQEGFMDCPTREKGQYLNDCSVSACAYTLLTGDAALMKKALYDYARSAFITPGLMTCAPGALMQEIADATMQFPMQVLFCYRQSGDKKLLSDLLPVCEAAAEHFRKFDRGDGLLELVDSWNLIDWPENLRDDYDFPATKPIGPGAHNVMNAFWYGMQCDIEKIRAELGLPADSSAAERTAKAFVNEFYDAEQKLFTDAKATKHTSTHSNLLPLFFGLDRFAGEGCRPVIVDFIRRKGVGCMGVSMSYFLLAGLKKAGEDEAVDELLHSPAGWLNMLREGATTTYEAWGRDQKWNTSLFHPWATAPILIMADKNLHP